MVSNRTMYLSLFYTFLIVLISFAGLGNAVAVMSVDLGSEFMKVAIVSPGVPMEIAMNGDSQRKSPVVVAFRDGERMFGELAVTTGVRFPEKAFVDFIDLLGKDVEHPVAQRYMARFPYHKLVTDEQTKGIAMEHPEGGRYTVEELTAMMLRYARDFAEITAGQPIRDVVVTVPPYFNQAERRAMARAVQIAELNLLQLISDNSAVALNYGVFRRKEFNSTPVNILFYDMGSSSTRVTVVSYQTIKSKEGGRSETVPLMTVRGVGFDRTLGGNEFKFRLAHHLAKKFNELKKASKDVLTVHRAFAKIVKEAERVKKILSANTEINAQIENVMEDIDFKQPVSRQEFEELCADLFERVVPPIEAALQAASMDLSAISQVIVVGGNTRIPLIQKKLESFLEGKNLGKSVNADEASALGAAYQAASLSKGFRVKPFQVKEANIYPIQVSVQRKSGEGSQIKRTLFHRNNPYPQKKVMTFGKETDDFDLSITYGDLQFLSERDLASLGSLDICKVHLTGVADALGKHAGEEGVERKGIKAHFRLDDSGILHLDKVNVLYEKQEQDLSEQVASTLSKIGSTLGKMFMGDEENATVPEAENATDAKENKTAEAKENKTEKVATPKVVQLLEPVGMSMEALDKPHPDDAYVIAAKKTLKELAELDRARHAKEKAKNALESFIHETKDKLYTDEYERAILPDDRDVLVKDLSAASEWLEYETDGIGESKPFEDKLTELKKATKDLFERVREHQERPAALASLRHIMNLSEVYLHTIKNISEDEQVFTAVEIDTLEKAINETRVWQFEQETQQNQTQLHETPKLTLRMIFEKIQLLDRETKYLINKARYAVPKKKAEAARKKVEEEGNKTGEGEGEEEEEVKGDEEESPKEEGEQLKEGEKKPQPEQVKESEADTHTEL